MAEENDGASKTEEPTPRKLDNARAQGDVPKTPDLPSLMAFTASAAVLAMMGGTWSRHLAAQMVPFLADAGQISLDGGAALQLGREALLACAPIGLTVILVAAAAGVAGHMVQTGLMFTPSKLKPDFKKLSPIGGLKRLFGIDGAMNFLKSLLKVFATSAIAWFVLKPHLESLRNLAELEVASILPLACDILRRLAFSIGGLMLLVAGADWFWQKQRWMSRMKMSKEEVKEDFKQTEGDPHVKAKQKQLRQVRARQRMMQAVPQATVVVMNPTHYAVALKYEQGEDEAPTCVAKGLDSLALKIRAIAEEAGVPIVEDPPLARALYAAVEVEEMIPPAHYAAVAKIIGFILNAGKKRVGAL